MLRWSSSSATLWLWQPLLAVFARHTLVAFQCFCGRSSQPRGYYDAFATARAGCSAVLPPEGTAQEAPRRCLLRHPGHQKAAGRRRSGLLGDDTAWLPLLQVWGVKTCSPDTWQLWFSYLVFLFLHVAVFWFFEVGRRAAAAPGLLRLGLPSKVTCGRVTKTHAAISFFTRWLFAPLLWE